MNDEFTLNLIITKSLKIKINLKKYIYKYSKRYIYNTSNEKKINDIKNTIVTMKYNKKLLRSIINIFNGNVVYLSVNSYYYLDNLNLYLSMYYLYSYIQNLLYINLNKVSATCFKTRLKNTLLNTELELDLETRLYKVLILLIKKRKEIFKIKERYNEQSSNRRIVKNINVQH